MSVPYYGDFPEDHTNCQIPFNTFSSDDPSASVTITDLADTDVWIYKDSSATQYAADAAVDLSLNHDGITGSHLCKIDLSENAYFATGSEYAVRIVGTTVDGAQIDAWIGAFSIERAGGTIALLKLIQAAVITNAVGADVSADIATAQADLDLLTGADGATLASVQGNYAPNTVVPDAAGVAPTAVEIRTEMDSNSTELAKIGTIPALDGAGQTIGEAIAKLADDNGGATFNAGEDSLNKIRDDRTLAAADYVVVGDTLAAVTDVTNDVGITQTGADKVWGTAARTLTAGTNLNDISVADIIAGVADGSYDLQEMLRLITAACVGKSSGGGTTTIKFRDTGDGKDRITATVDADGNRSALTLDAS